MLSTAEAPRNCPKCPRLVAYRKENKAKEPRWFNGAVPCFGADDAYFLIVGLAPGRAGANRTGRPFTGDYAGELLYKALAKYGFSQGRYAARADDGITLRGTMITNAVRCVPPKNSPNGMEKKMCRAFLQARLAALVNLKIILALGGVAHHSIIAALGLKQKDFPFAHGTRHDIKHTTGDYTLYDSYHCSRYNVSTKVLTEKMFFAVFERIQKQLA